MKNGKSPSHSPVAKELSIREKTEPAKHQKRKGKLDTEKCIQEIRKRAIRMTRSSEWTDLSAQLIRSFSSTGFLTKRARIYLALADPVKDKIAVRISHADGKFHPEIYEIPAPYPFSLKKKTGLRNRKELQILGSFTGPVLDAYIKFLWSLTSNGKDGELMQLLKTAPKKIVHTDAVFLHGSLGIMSVEPPGKKVRDTLARFADVFELIYKRYLDLKKAEDQEREMLIQDAFERVRVSSMAMHKSIQLAETAKVLFEQFDQLGKIPDRMSIGIINEESNKVELWVTDQMGKQVNHEYFFSIDEPTSISKIVSAWKEKKDAAVVDLTGQNLQDWLQFVKEEARLPIDETRIRGRRVQQAAFFSQGFLLFTTNEPVAEEIMHLLVRFARVFDLAYTRFRDLLMAETQAREAIKTSALDRLRAEIASMRNANDLQKITPLVWRELKVLGISFVRCGVFIIDESLAVQRAYLSSPDGNPLAILNLPFHSNLLTEQTVIHWRNGLVYRKHWNREEFVSWMQTMIDQGQVENREHYQGAMEIPESLDLHFVPFAQGMLYVGNTTPLSAYETDLVKCLAESFSIAYARYEDFDNLEKAKQKVEYALSELKATQAQLIQSEKMASLGELTAGIAHEIQNPLNFVNNFSELNKELIAEMKEAIAAENYKEVQIVAKNIEANEEKINNHGRRADAIVKSMLEHSQTNTGTKEPTDINSLAEEYLRLSYQGIRAKDRTFNAFLRTDFDETLENISIIPQDIKRVLLNLYNNAFYAVNEKRKTIEGDYEPFVSVTTRHLDNMIEISVRDNGTGIPAKIMDKIFQPFFTTKPTGQGTGLGLSLSYDIIKSHGAELKVESKEGEGSEFIIQLPIK
jgi:signal transduction histidine kinase